MRCLGFEFKLGKTPDMAKHAPWFQIALESSGTWVGLHGSGVSGGMRPACVCAGSETVVLFPHSSSSGCHRCSFILTELDFVNVTPSALSLSDWPGQCGAGRPCALTTLWQGISDSNPKQPKILPTCRACEGWPAREDTSPYVSTFPAGIALTTCSTDLVKSISPPITGYRLYRLSASKGAEEISVFGFAHPLKYRIAT